MSTPQRADADRLDELLAAEASRGLDEAEFAELDRLLAQESGADRDEFMQLAALVQSAFLRGERQGQQRMPDHLRQRLLQQAGDHFSARTASRPATPATAIESAGEAAAARKSPLRMGRESAGWLMAALLALAFVVLRPDLPTEVAAPAAALAADREALLADDGTLVAPWLASTEPGYTGVTGDVVWNDRTQRGYLRLAGMPANDPAQRQYQLWIVDPDRDANPVDGGVFDIPAGAGEIIVPIKAKLGISGPAAFAITTEQPGGVVVSTGPLLVVAPVRG